MQLMHICSRQEGLATPLDTNGIPILRTKGSTGRCFNLRSSDDGVLDGVGTPRHITTLPYRPAFCDSRLGETYIFAVNDSLQLILAGRITPGGRYIDIGQHLGVLTAPLRSASSCGEFLVLNLDDDSLFYLLFHPDRLLYTPLGAIPEIGDISVERFGEREFSSTLSGIDFSVAIEDMREEVPKAVRRHLDATLKSAYASIKERAAAEGMWLQPVSVRVAVRLWNGSLLHLSDPVVAPSVGYGTGGRPRFNLATSAGRFSGIGPSTLSMVGYKMRVKLPAASWGAWRDVVRSVEVWVSEEQDPVDASAEASVVYNDAGNTPALYANLRSIDINALADDISAQPRRRVAVVDISTYPEHLEITDLRNAPTYSSGFGERMPRGLRAAVASGYAGFLHLGGIGISAPTPATPMVMPVADADTLPKADCVVCVRLRGNNGDLFAVHSCKVPSCRGIIVPYLWYPSPDAVEMTVAIREADGSCYQSSFPLSGVRGGEDAVAFVNPEMKPWPLESVAALDLPAAETSDAEMEWGRLITMRCGDPFTIADDTRDIGGDISVLVAQPVGGGAYTRQYLYAFTDHGVTALTHDRAGRHLNSRLISGIRLVHPRRAIGTPQGVWVLSHLGSLLLLQDSKVHSKLTGIDWADTIAYDARRDELWLIPDSTGPRFSVVVNPSKPINAAMEGSMRTLRPDRLFCRDGTLLYSSLWGRNFRVYEHEQPVDVADATTLSTASWASRAMPLRGSRLVALCADMERPHELEATISLRVITDYVPLDVDPFDQGTMLYRTDISGEGRATCVAPLQLPAINPAGTCRQMKYRLTVCGTFGTLVDAAIRPCG